MAKQPKISQTDYTRGGRDISNTAIPLYQQNLTQLGDYVSNVQNRLDPYLENYINLGQAASQSDFLRNYQRAMGQATAGNYAATTGGYSSLNQQGYDDQQRYYNDLAARMYSQGLGQAAELANQEYQILANTPAIYNQAYQLGKAYSDVQQYNDMADQLNKNWWAPALGTVGQIGGAIAGGIIGGSEGAALGSQLGGGVLGMAGRAFTMDPSALRAVGGATPTETEQRQGIYSDAANARNISQGLTNLFGNYDWFNDNPLIKKNSSTNNKSLAPVGNTNPKPTLRP